MTFLTDGTAVKFTGIDHTFNVYSTFVEFNIGSSVFSVKFYGLIIAFGFLLAVLFGGRMAYKWKMDLNKMLDVLLYGTIGGIIGARLYYVAFEWDYYSQNLSEIPKIWNGGLAIYGGLIGGIIAAAITCKVDKMDFLKLLDLAGMSFLIGQGIGRWGNYANQEAFGTNTTMPWGMTSSKVVDYIVSNQALFRAKGIEMSPNVPVHPTFLYESVWCLLGFLVIYIICRKFYKFSGQLILCYGVIYGAERAVVEGLRTDSLYIGSSNLRVSQLLSMVIAVVCLAILTAKLVSLKKHPKPFSPVEVREDAEKSETSNSDAEDKKKNKISAEKRREMMRQKERKNDGDDN